MKTHHIGTLRSPALLAALSLAAFSAQAQTTETLNFGSPMTNAAQIENYFNGGQDSLGSRNGTGPSDNAVFNNSAESLLNTASGGTGKFENLPSNNNGVLFFNSTLINSTNGPAAMNVAEGFTSFSTSYSLLNNLSTYAGSINLYSGQNGTGTLLDTITLSAAGTTVACTSSKDEFCSWSSVSASNFGVAQSAVFVTTSTAVGTEFDAVTITAVPEPATYGLMAAGLAAMGVLSRLRRR
jgi:hypothetical protein